jgi:hypothetical protein
VLDLVEEGRVFRAGEPDGHTAGLVVGGDDDERLVGMLFVELDGLRNGVVEGDGVVNRGSRVVGVAGSVDLAGLDHQEEAIGVVEQLDALPGHIDDGDYGFLNKSLGVC